MNLLISATVALASVLIYDTEALGRRLGDYLLIYSVVWGFVILVLLLVTFKLVKVLNNLKIIVLGLTVGYLSSVLAHIIAIVLDVSSIRTAHSLLPMEGLVVPLIFPFFILRGWVFSAVFIAIALLLNKRGKLG